MGETLSQLWEAKCEDVSDLREWCDKSIEWLSENLKNRAFSPSDAFNPECHRIARRAWEHASLLCPPDVADQLGPLPITPPTVRCGQALSDLKRLAEWCRGRQQLTPTKVDHANDKGQKMNDRRKVFVSHSSKDKPFVRRLVDELNKHNVQVWFDERAMEVGDSIVDGISTGLKDADYLLVVLSQNSVQSRWMKNELNAALMGETSKGDTVILPAVIDDCEIPILLKDRIYADSDKTSRMGSVVCCASLDMKLNRHGRANRNMCMHLQHRTAYRCWLI